jgi:hypothetical protein
VIHAKIIEQRGVQECIAGDSSDGNGLFYWCAMPSEFTYASVARNLFVISPAVVRELRPIKMAVLCGKRSTGFIQNRFESFRVSFHGSEYRA